MDTETQELTQEELRDLQQVCLGMAKTFFDFCQEKGLTAYLCGGGCIGALRHKGFIPWDDDLDFFMPREDYERFIREWDSYEAGKYMALSVTTEDYVDRNLFATLRNKNTTFIKTYQKDLDLVHGVALDIIPLDGYPDSSLQRRIQCLWALVYSLFCAQTVPVNHGGALAAGSKVLLSIFRGKGIRYKIWSMAKKHMTKYSMKDCEGATELCSGPGYMRNRLESKWFDSYVAVPFEDTELPIPIGADEYLRKVFGDYMELPEEAKRKPHHDAVLVDVNTPYEPREKSE